MADPTPPPEEPMDEATRARIRARLDAATGRDGTPAGHRWLVPLGAAAAVLVIAATAGYAVFRSDPAGVPGPAGLSSSVPVPTVAPSPPPIAPSETPTPPPLAGDPASAGGSCEKSAPRRLPGAEQVASLRLPDGEAEMWVAGDRSVVCEDSGGIVTFHRARDAAPPETLDSESLGFSTSTYRFDEDGMLTSYVAGGPVPPGVTGLEYTFPGGHTEAAAVSRDAAGQRWWLMGYVPTDGPLADPDVNVLRLDPVHVDVFRSGEVEQYDLEFGHADCAQANHGC